MCDAAGLPLAVGITGGNRHDSIMLEPLLDGLRPVKGRGPEGRRYVGLEVLTNAQLRALPNGSSEEVTSLKRSPPRLHTDHVVPSSSTTSTDATGRLRPARSIEFGLAQADGVSGGGVASVVDTSTRMSVVDASTRVSGARGPQDCDVTRLGHHSAGS